MSAEAMTIEEAEETLRRALRAAVEARRLLAGFPPPGAPVPAPLADELRRLDRIASYLALALSGLPADPLDRARALASHGAAFRFLSATGWPGA
jgi:hypothetical protein